MKDGRRLARLFALAIVVLVAVILFAATAGGPGGGSVSAQTVATGAALDASAAARGFDIIQTYGCLTCHSTTAATLVGPPLLDLYGSEVTLVGGARVVADDAYLRRAILEAHREVVESFPPEVMPTYVGVLSDEQVTDIIAYLRSIGTQSGSEISTAATPVATGSPVVAATLPVAIPGEDAAMAQSGLKLIASFGCLNCHTITGAPLIGPTFRGLFGSSIPLMEGYTVQGDEEYLRRSIISAHEQTVQGFPALVMPSYKGLISNEDLGAMVAYLRTLAAPLPAATPLAAAPAEDAALVATGAGLVQSFGCLGCHTTNGAPLVGPTFRGLYGSTVNLVGSGPTQADENYLRRSIMAAHEQIVDPFPNVMPGYAGVISPEQLTALVAYLKSLAAPAAATPTPEATQAPQDAAVREAVMAVTGAQLVRTHGCLSCHTTNGAALIGPTFRGLYGSTVRLSTGEDVIAGEGFLRRSIVAAHEQIVEGFPTVMPSYFGVFTPGEVDDIVAYLKTLVVPAAAPPSAQEMALIATGAGLVKSLGCLGCHTTTGATLIGPTFLDLYGSTVLLQGQGGAVTVADEQYLRQSIVAAHQQVVQGFPLAMPDYSGVLNPDQLTAMVTYLKSLSSLEVPAPGATAGATGAAPAATAAAY